MRHVRVRGSVPDMKLAAAIVVTFTLVLSGCGGGKDSGPKQAPIPTAANGKPACTDIWAKGNTLPKNYDGCNRVDGSVAEAVFYDCKNGGKLASSSDSDALPGGTGNFFALFGGKVKSGDANSAAYNAAFTKCMAS
jgi:hypothetical protein